MAKRADDPYALTYTQIYAQVFTHFAKESGRPAKAIAHAADCSEPYLSQIRRAERLPSLDKSQDLDRAIGADGCLFEVRRLIDRLQGIRAVNLGTQPPPSDTEDPVRRRELLQDTAALAVGATVAPILTTLTRSWQDSEPKLPGASVSQAMIDDWETAAGLHAQRARIDPSSAVLAALATDFADMAPHLARKQPDPIRRDLSHAAARHTALIAGKWADLGNRREARRWWHKTRELSDLSGDRMLASWLRRRETLHRRGDPREDPDEVLAVAREARHLAGPGPSAPLVAAMTEEAKTLAVTGRHQEAVAALREAEETFDRLPSTTGDYRSFSERQLWFDRSLIYTLAGDAKRAGHAQDVARSLYPPADQAVPRIGLHSAALHARNDPADAARAAVQVLGRLPQGRWITRYRTDARLVLDALPEQARELPETRELRALTGG